MAATLVQMESAALVEVPAHLMPQFAVVTDIVLPRMDLSAVKTV